MKIVRGLWTYRTAGEVLSFLTFLNLVSLGSKYIYYISWILIHLFSYNRYKTSPYYMSWPILYSKLRYKMGQDFLELDSLPVEGPGNAVCHGCVPQRLCVQHAGRYGRIVVPHALQAGPIDISNNTCVNPFRDRGITRKLFRLPLLETSWRFITFCCGYPFFAI